MVWNIYKYHISLNEHPGGYSKFYLNERGGYCNNSHDWFHCSWSLKSYKLSGRGSRFSLYSCYVRKWGRGRGASLIWWLRGLLLIWERALIKGWVPIQWNMVYTQLNLYILTSVCIFSILFSIHFQRCWQGEFFYQSKASLVGDHLLYSCDLTFWFRGDIV